MTNFLLAIIAAVLLVFLHGCVSFASAVKETEMYQRYETCSKYYSGYQLNQCRRGDLVR